VNWGSPNRGAENIAFSDVMFIYVTSKNIHIHPLIKNTKMGIGLGCCAKQKIKVFRLQLNFKENRMGCIHLRFEWKSLLCILRNTSIMYVFKASNKTI